MNPATILKLLHVLAAFALVTLVLLPCLYVFVPEGNALHVSAYTVTLGGKLRLFALLDYKGGHYLYNVKDQYRC